MVRDLLIVSINKVRSKNMSTTPIHNVLKDAINIKPNRPRGFSYQKSILEVSDFKLPDKIPNFVKSNQIRNIFDDYKKIRTNFTKIVGEKSLKVIESVNLVEKLKKNALKLLKDIHDLGYLKDGLEKEFLLKLKNSSLNIKNISERLLNDFDYQNKNEVSKVINEALTTKKQDYDDKNSKLKEILKSLDDLKKDEKLDAIKKKEKEKNLMIELNNIMNR
jgi:hypothetical protein